MSNINRYRELTPKFDIRQVLAGPLRATGILFDLFGRQQRRFSAQLMGVWQGNQGQLHEEFTFDDGEQQTRTWKISLADDQVFTATAGDVTGTARGEQCGNAVNMKYALLVIIGKNSIKIAMDDWMYLRDAKTIINRTVMRKFGLKVGELILVIEKC